MRHFLTDLPLFMESVPFSNPTTSRDAAEDIKPHLARLEALVLDFIRSRGDFGACDHETEAATGLMHQTASARRRELVSRGLVVASGKYRITPSGRRAIVWIVK